MNASPARVLMVCTGNICRSPSMHYWAAQQWGDAAEIRSAGTYAEIGMDATGPMRRAAQAHGLTMPAHEPRQLDTAAVQWADLVLVATATHADWLRRHAVTPHASVPPDGSLPGNGSLPEKAQPAQALPDHVFGLHEAVDLTARATAPEGDSPADRLRGVAASLARARRTEPVTFRDLDDPWGLDHDTHARVMGEIADAIDALSRWAGLD